MIRTFHPIGQGAFYTEVFDNFTIVYDCGTATDTKKDLIHREIQSTFKKDTKIDAVFISHLHEDHVNGLEFLLEHCTVHRLFLPLLSDLEKIQLVIHNTVRGSRDPFVESLIINPVDIINRDVQIYFVPQVEEEKQEGEFIPRYIEELTETRATLEQRVKLISKRISDWVFIPFNFQRSERTSLLNNELAKRGIAVSEVNSFDTLWSNRENKSKIIEAYKSIPGNFNTNSLTLYSGPEGSDKFPVRGHSLHGRYRFCYSPYFDGNASGCLYFGDYETRGVKKWEQLFNLYRDYWKNIGLVQIPHHGSRHNYNREINKTKPMVSVISAGKSNSHRHPHSSTIKDIIIDGGYPIIINEDVCSRIQYEIYGI